LRSTKHSNSKSEIEKDDLVAVGSKNARSLYKITGKGLDSFVEELKGSSSEA